MRTWEVIFKNIVIYQIIRMIKAWKFIKVHDIRGGAGIFIKTKSSWSSFNIPVLTYIPCKTMKQGYH